MPLYPLIYVLINFVVMFIEIITLAMTLRAIINWFFDADGKFIRFLYVLTEPAIINSSDLRRDATPHSDKNFCNLILFAIIPHLTQKASAITNNLYFFHSFGIRYRYFCLRNN